MKRNRYPMSNDRLGWHKFYAARFNKTGSWQAEQLSLWYLFLHLAFDEPAEQTRNIKPLGKDMMIDMDLLIQQQQMLVDLAAERFRLGEDTELLDGVINLLSGIQDELDPICTAATTESH